QWAGLLTAKKLFPLRAILRYDVAETPSTEKRDVAATPSSRSTEKRDEGVAATGREHFRFEVKSVTPEKISDREGKLFQPPSDYYEIEPLPF
ncbi:MAG: hypothetical protein M3Y82_10030, partial [Verrucomicrobiota bacterium]|nr:hypothetical protein [Verrucomicrobiota bacterium]